ncbi:MAG: iron-containing alcohol dehydrogenase [Acidimicrobiales bacterium]|nr:iron-containing alcohol dehydrogenase [Acidimicrobiales bacterium]
MPQPTVVGPRTVEVPSVLRIASGAIDTLADLLSSHFDVSEVVIVTGASASWQIASTLQHELRSDGHDVREFRDPRGDTSSVTDLVEILDQRPASLLVAFGGGRPTDVAKLAASRTKIDLVVVPTILSHDGICSPVASVVTGDNRRRSLPAATPTGIVIDTALLASAPERYLRAGVGDLLSNITAVADWRLASDGGAEPIDEIAASMALAAAQSVLEVDWPPSEHSIGTIARGLVMSGLAMEIAGSSRPCSGAEHLISHALDELHPGASTLHGEQVALGTLISSYAQDHPERQPIVDLFERIGFPATARGWGWTEEDLVRAVEHAPDTRPDRRTILDIDASRSARALVAAVSQ